MKLMHLICVQNETLLNDMKRFSQVLLNEIIINDCDFFLGYLEILKIFFQPWKLLKEEELIVSGDPLHPIIVLLTYFMDVLFNQR